MSVISTHHQFVPFISTGKDKSKPLSGQRLIKVIYKSRGENEAKHQNVCASVPIVNTEDINPHVSALMPYIRNLVSETQDKIARERYESGATVISDDDISMSSVIAYLDSDSTSGRMTGDDIRTWFNTELHDILIVAMADKMGISDSPTPEQTVKLEQSINVYRDKFASLAGGKTVISPAVCDRLLTAIAFGDSENAVTVKLTKRLTDMKSAHTDTLFAL